MKNTYSAEGLKIADEPLHEVSRLAMHHARSLLLGAKTVPPVHPVLSPCIRSMYLIFEHYNLRINAAKMKTPRWLIQQLALAIFLVSAHQVRVNTLNDSIA